MYQRLQKEEITRNRSDNESLSFRSITKIAAIHNPHTTQKMTDRKQVVCRVVDHNYPHLDIDSAIDCSITLVVISSPNDFMLWLYYKGNKSESSLWFSSFWT